MNKTLKIKLKVFFLITICIFSILFYIYAIQIKNLEKNNENYAVNDYKLDVLDLIGTSNEEIYVESFENSRIRESNNFLEELLKKQEICFFIFCFGAFFLSFELLAFFKYSSINKKSNDTYSLKIEDTIVTEEELMIFNLIQEYLNQNRVFTKESVVSYIKSRSKTNGNLNCNGINTVIDSLLKKNLIFEGSKFTRKTVLLNSNREIVYNMIKKCPGIYMNKLSKKLDLSPFVIKWHLSILLKFNLIRKQNLNKNISYFISSLNDKNDNFFHIISREKCLKIIRLLNKNNKGYTKNQIAKLLNMHYNTVTKYLNEIDKFNLLIKKQVNRTEYMALDKKGYRSIIKES